MAILKHIASKSSNYGAALEYLIFKHDELRKTPILDQNGNRIMRDEFYLDGLNCEPYSFDAACQQLNREYQKNKNKDEIKSHHYIISFDPRDSTENCLTGKRAQELGLEYAKANFPGHQALVCTHMDGHNGSGNIHVHIVINSLRKLDVPKQPFMERPIDSKAGYKHHVTNEYLKHLQKSLMDLCRREFLHQIDLLSPSRTGVTEAEYWAQRRLDEKKQKIETEGFTPNPTKFQTQKQLIRDAVAAVREKAISYEDFQDILQDEYNIFVKTQRGRYSYLPPERNKFISERSLGESCKRECLEGFFVQNAEKNLRYKEEPILIFTTRTRLRLVVDLQENVKAQENLAYALKVKISNLQRMAESVAAVKELIGRSQMIFLPGGFSGGDEPEGSAKFITAFFRNPAITEAVRGLLQKRDGLMLGICNGFQALIKLGLVPFGDIVETDDTCPTLTFNTIGRHQSMLVRTRVASNLSPWLQYTKPGDVHTVAVSHGEGRFVAGAETLDRLVKNGQIATQYVDLSGKPTMDVRHNPNGSYYAVEGITSPDGRVLGKMGHSERSGDNLYKNVDGNKYQKLFEGGVDYFKL